MRIALDAMGTDHHPGPEVEAARRATEIWPDSLILVGPEERLEPALRAASAPSDRIRIVHAPEVLGMADKPADSARGKSGSSMAVGMDLVKHGEADVFVTCGNTGGAMATALFRLGRMRGVKRPALAAIFPARGGQVVVLDIGANADVRPEYLVQFAALGCAYAQIVLQRPEPKVALLTNGEEPGKGNEIIKEAFPLLERAPFHFVGGIEPKELYAGQVDVAVTDGFTGNVFLKTSEAVAAFLVEMIRDEIRSAPLTTLGGALARPAFRKVGRKLDPTEYGAVPLLGIDGLVFVGHGRFEAEGVLSAVRAARMAVERGLLEALRRSVGSLLEAEPAP